MNNNTIARFAGLLYLLLIVLGVYAQIFVRSSLIIPDDTLATVNNLTANIWQFKLAFIADIGMMLTYFFLVMALYQLLKAFGNFAALLMVLSVVISTSIMVLNMLNHFAVVILLSGATYLAGLETNLLHTLVMFFLDLHKYGYICAQVFFGLWLFPLGYLAYKSGYFPKILGILLMLACIAYLIDFVLLFLFPSYQVMFNPIYSGLTSIAEFTFCFWLFVMKDKKTKNTVEPKLVVA